MDTNKQYDEFSKVISEFIPDLLTTFPEFKDNLHTGIIYCFERSKYLKYMKDLGSSPDSDEDDGDDDFDAKIDAQIEKDEKSKDNSYLYDTDEFKQLLDHCKEVYPPRFFDIIYQNNDIFADKDVNTQFLPNIDFSLIWSNDISEKTKEVIWKYLQMILLTCVPDVSDGKSFGDTAKLFEAIDEDEFKGKLEETLKSMQSMFSEGECERDTTKTSDVSGSNINFDNMPNPDDIHKHINSMLGGKLGKLAEEIAEETADELGIDLTKESDLPSVFKKLFKNPGKLMSMVKGIGNKLESKMSSGELSQSELMKEASEMMKKMQDVPGMEGMDKILKQFGVPMGKDSNISSNAFQAHMNENIKTSQTRERMLKKMEQNKKMRNEQQNEVMETHVFSKGEEPLKSSKSDKPSVKQSNKKHKKKKKNNQK